MNEWQGPSAVAPTVSEEELSKAVQIGGPVGGALSKVFKFFAWVLVGTLGLVVAVMVSFLHDSITGKGNQQRRR